MTGRERVLAAINHREPDRVPIVLGASNTTGMKAKPYRGLKQLCGIEAEERYLYDWRELGTVKCDETLLNRLHSDVRGVHDRFPEATYTRNFNRPSAEPYITDWGCPFEEVEPDTWFQFTHPLADAQTPEEVLNYPHWPEMNDPYRVAHVRALTQQLASQNQHAIMATPWLLSIFERAIGMQGMVAFLMNMGENPDLARVMLTKITECCKTLMGNFLRECGDNLDIICIGDDLGTQSSLLVSPQMYRAILKPFHADFIAFIKARTRAKLFFHTDGDVVPLIDDLVEIGVDILNPIQTSAGKMADLAALKKRYGSNLVFCGAIDTHRILPFGTPAQVRQEVRRVIETLAPGGGYMVAAVHTIMNDVPAENVLAMVDAVEEFGTRPLQG